MIKSGAANKSTYCNIRDKLGRQRVNRVEQDIIRELISTLQEVNERLDALEDEVFKEGGE